MTVMHRHFVNGHMGDQLGSGLVLLVLIALFAIGFNDLRDIAVAFMRVEAGIGIGRVADGIARHILRRARSAPGS